jgi:hypothetical protein
MQSSILSSAGDWGTPFFLEKKSLEKIIFLQVGVEAWHACITTKVYTQKRKISKFCKTRTYNCLCYIGGQGLKKYRNFFFCYSNKITF